jgi:uncharacterized protein
MQSPPESLAVRALRRLASAVYHYPRLFFYPQVVLLGLAVYYTIENLQFSTSRNDLVGSEKKYHQNFLRFKQEFGAQDDLVAVVESEDMEKNRQFVERLGARLEAEPELFIDVFYKGDLKMLGPKALLFLPEETLRDLHKTLRDYRPFIEQFSKATNLNSLYRLVNAQFRSAARGTNEQTESMIQALPALRRIIEQANASLKRPGTPPSPGVDALFNAGPEAEQQQYITFAEGRLYLVTARAPREELNPKAVERLRQLVAQTQAEVPGVNVGITGEPVLEFDEMRQSQEDSTVATIVSLVLVALIFVFGYKETGRPIKATICLIVGLGYTMGYTTLVIGHLNILTVTFLPILIGLAIDFGVHLITRYEEELRHGQSTREALERAMVNTGLGIFTGCFTTAGAFFAMGLTDFKGIQEMGIITGGGMLICLVPMMTMLPALLKRGRQNIIDHKWREVDTRARIERLWLERPILVGFCTLAVALFCVLQFRKVYFDYNLLHMQSKGLPAVEFEHKLINSASKSVLFAAVVANSLEEAIRLENQITNLSTVASVDSMSQFLAAEPAEKLRIIRQIKSELATLEFPEYESTPVITDELSQTLFYTQSYLGLAIGEAQKEKADPALVDELKALRQAIVDFRYELATRSTPRTPFKLAAFQQAFFKDIHDTFHALKNQDARTGLRIEDLPQGLRNRFIGRTGKYLLQVYPKEDVWERQNQEAFVQELRTVDPNVTGTPVQLYEYTTLLKDSYVKAAWYALGAIVILVLFHFRSIPCLILALMPVALGSTWMAGFMGLAGVPFNPANIMTLPLVIGIGVTNGIHILNRFAEEQNPGILAKSTGKAVLVSALTTVAGFGSLIPAQHQGISSLGIVMAVGVTTCMLAALTFLPALLNLLNRWGWTIKKPSGNNALLTLGREEPR